MKARKGKIEIPRGSPSAVVAETTYFGIARSLLRNYIDIVYD
jgi:hypothetical protein